MTNDLAIKIINGDVLGTTEQTHEAVAMAVKALSALPSAQPNLQPTCNQLATDCISRQALSDAMYHEAFEKDTDMQKWDSGCWIRYKLFENVLRGIPSADVVEVVRCKDCKFNPNDTWFDCPMVHLPYKEDRWCWKGERKDG